ncbi:MAG: hypothetical protein ACREYE_00375 [Gammaproteobacteria bacterium]
MRNPHVFQYTLRLLVPSLGLAPAGRARRFAPGETLLRSGRTRPSFARDDFFTSSETYRYAHFEKFHPWNFSHRKAKMLFLLCSTVQTVHCLNHARQLPIPPGISN